MRPRNQFVGPHHSHQRTREAGAGGLFLLWLSFRTTWRVPPFDLEQYAMVGLNCYHRHVSERSVTRTFMLSGMTSHLQRMWLGFSGPTSTFPQQLSCCTETAGTAAALAFALSPTAITSLPSLPPGLLQAC